MQSEGRKWEVAPGHIYIVPPDTVYSSYKLSKGALCFFWCRFTMSEISTGTKYKLKNLIDASSGYITGTIIRELSSGIEDGKGGEYTSFLLTSLLYSFTNTGCKVEKKSTPDQFNKILSYIEENISSSISASSIAGHFGYNPAYFTRLFTKKTGMAPMEYIKQQRIQLAKELLVRPYDSVRDIGSACGYPDEKYFSRLFKKSEGITPSQYRKENLAE